MAGKKKYRDEQGFTFVELLLSMGIAAVVMASIYAVYFSQQKSFTTQEKVAAMHQNVRAAMYYMERDIRMRMEIPRQASVRSDLSRYLSQRRRKTMRITAC